MVSSKNSGKVKRQGCRWRRRTAEAIALFFIILLSVSPLIGTPALAGSSAASPAHHPSTQAPSAVAPANRIVSFAPSNTELLFSIGSGNRLLGVCTYCDYPKEAAAREKVGTFVSANMERLARLKPDTIVLVSGQEGLASQLKHNGFNVRLLVNNRLSDIGANLRVLGQMTGRPSDADAIAAAFEKSLNSLHVLIASAHTQPKIFYCVWPQPLITVGNSSFLNDVITACGGTNVAANLSAGYPQFSAEKLLVSNPSIVVLPFESEKQNVLSRAPWTSLSAVKSHHYFYLPETDKNLLMRPTLRIIDGMEWLSERLHPEIKTQLQKWRDDANKAIKLASPKMLAPIPGK
ncbi:MAG TPA: helical backbone metal receptor [Trichormus sp.]